jgi:prevent-host-death family protein
MHVKITSTEAQNNFGKYLRMAADLEVVIITKNGRETAKMVSCQEPLAGGVSEKAAGYLYNHRERMDYEAFLIMTEKSEQRFEYIDGEVYLMASPVYNHQIVVMEILVQFYNWFKGKKCRVLASPFDVTLVRGKENMNVVQPDVLVVCDPEKVNEAGIYKGIPSLVVEVLSPSTRSKDMLRKLDLYLQTGVREYWMVDPDKREVMLYCFDKMEIQDYQTVSGNGTIQSRAFPGLEICLGDMFTD